MTVLSETSVPVADEARSNTMLYVVLAVVAALALLVFAAMMSNDARVGDGSTNQLSTYVTGQSQILPPVTSEYTQDDAAQHRTQLGR